MQVWQVYGVVPFPVLHLSGTTKRSISGSYNTCGDTAKQVKF